MDRSTPGNIIEASTEPTVASVLGVTGALRFHPHGSTQKAHVVLRQVEISEDSEEEVDPSMIYFSLFAQKRIEVKPGKEILLAVAAPDGRFIDTPVILAAKVNDGSAPPEVHILPTQNRMEVIAAAMESTMPPKMRKTWSKRFDITQPSASVSRSYASASVQTEIEPEDEKPFSTEKVAIVQNLQSPSQQRKVPSRRDRSLSPMDLDSPNSSPSLSPRIPSPVPPSSRTKSTSFSPPGLWISTSPIHRPSHEPEAPITPLHLSPDSDNPPGLSSLPRPGQPQATAQKDDKKTGPPASTVSDASQSRLVSSSEGVLEAKEPLTPSPSPSDASSTPAPYIPKRKIVPNPFVSGGLLTDFVGATPTNKVPTTNGGQVVDLSKKSDHDATNHSKAPSPPNSVSPPPGLNSYTPSSTVGTSKDTARPPSTARSVSPNIARTPLRTKSPVLQPPTSASSSKVKIEDVPPVVPDTTSSTQAAPPPAPSPQIPLPANLFLPASDSRSSVAPQGDMRRRWSNGHARNPSPPPDPKVLPYVPSSSFSNPLNIRPSGGYGWRNDRQYSPTTPPAPPNPARKPVAIGAGWPYNRQMNGNNGRRPSFKRPTNGSDSGQLPSQATAFMQSQSPTQSAGPISGETEDGKFVGSTLPPLATQQIEKDGPSADITDIVGDTHERRSPTTPLSARSPTVSRSDSTLGPNNQALSNHPLPAKPPTFSGTPAAGAYSPHQGIKRMGSPIPPTQTPEPRRTRAFQWPVSEGVYSIFIKGDGDVGIRSIVHNSDGSMLAIICYDKSVRIWNNKNHMEAAKLAHNMQVTAVAWQDRDAGVITLGDNGIVSTWTRSAGNKWQWAKILDAGGDRKVDDGPCCLAFRHGRIAIAYPKLGVKVWLFAKGTWVPQRSIMRQNVTVIEFVEDGDALIGGTTDGVLWYCEVPNGTIRALAFMKSKIYALDVDPTGTYVLASQTGARAHLINIQQEDLKGNVVQAYSASDPELQGNVSYDFGALFASGGSSLLFGYVRGCILVWDRTSGEIVYGLQNSGDNPVQAVACFDRSNTAESHILTGTRQGLLTWFSQPPIEGGGRVSSK